VSAYGCPPGQAAYSGVIVAVLRTGARPWLILAAVLIVVGLLVVEGRAGTIILACGFLALLGAGIRLISMNDPAPREKGRVSAGHSGV
jgi:hypothetical protein